MRPNEVAETLKLYKDFKNCFYWIESLEATWHKYRMHILWPLICLSNKFDWISHTFPTITISFAVSGHFATGSGSGLFPIPHSRPIPPTSLRRGKAQASRKIVALHESYIAKLCFQFYVSKIILAFSQELLMTWTYIYILVLD